MIAMIFEYWFVPADDAAYEGYLEESSRLRELLPGVEGFLGIERYARTAAGSTAEGGSCVRFGY